MRISLEAVAAVVLVQVAVPWAIAQHQTPILVGNYGWRSFHYPTRPHPFKRFLHEIAKPLNALTGGFVTTSSHGHPDPAEMQYLLDPSNLEVTPAQAVAAKISLVEAWAPERRAAVRYLGSVDLHRYPEAEMALIAALREDPSECVRLEAALALGRTDFCTKQTMAALLLTVSGGTEDGCCAERSPRVRAAAIHALNRHMLFFERLPPEEPPPLEPLSVPPEPIEDTSKPSPGGDLRYVSYYTAKVGATPRRVLLQKAGRLLASLAGKGSRIAPHPGLLAAGRSVSRYRPPAKEVIPFDEAAIVSPVHNPAESHRGMSTSRRVLDSDNPGGRERSVGAAPVPWPGADPEPSWATHRPTFPVLGLVNRRRRLTRRVEPGQARSKGKSPSPHIAPGRESDRNRPPEEPIRLPDLESRLPRSRADAPALGGFALPVSRSSFTGMAGLVSRRTTGIDVAD